MRGELDQYKLIYNHIFYIGPSHAKIGEDIPLLPLWIDMEGQVFDHNGGTQSFKEGAKLYLVDLIFGKRWKNFVPRIILPGMSTVPVV